MQSVISYPDRGHWGDPKWRGNCSGRVYQDLFDQLQPKTFVDPMVGSGTSVEVAKEMGIQAWGLDLHSGFNAIADSILLAVGQQVDLCVSHPPYGFMECVNGIFEIFPKKNCSNTSTMGYSGVLNVEWIALL